MVEKVVMPQLGESVTEGTVSKWLVQVGDRVKKYDPLCEVSTDKVVAEVPSTFDGTIAEIVVREGQTVSVLSLICRITPEGEGVVSEPVRQAREGAPAAAASPPDMKQLYSPAVLKLAQEHGIELSMLQGTGTGGRITRADVLEIVEGKVNTAAAPVREAPADPMPRQHETVQETNEEDQVIPVSAVRRTIANRMAQSKQNAPHAWTMVQCDVTELVRYRSETKDEFRKKEGIRLSYMPFFIKSVVEALKEFPILNSEWAGDKIILKKEINISIAVATDDALFVPVIQNADQKSILGLAKAVDHLAVKSRNGKLTLEDLSGGTFTVNNTGSFGSVLSAPIINQPQAAILSFEAIMKHPVVIQNMIAIRDMMNICLSLDHRILDGLVCGRFLQSVKKRIESYGAETKLY